MGTDGKPSAVAVPDESMPQLAQDITHEEAALDKTDTVNDDQAYKYLASHNTVATPEEEKAVLRKIDWRIIPLLMAVNCIQLIDKNVCPSLSLSFPIKITN